ncbi:MAG: hypothetical protein NTY51_06760 [Deltaproteobacteria bacterium]|nr:hypothetical protein [Deltaproteobacteria bacterium]
MEARTFEMEFAKFIERFHQEIRDAFIEDTFAKRQLLANYRLGREMLEELADAVLSEFTINIDKRTTVESIADKYVQLGIRCCEDGLSYSEMIRVFTLLRRHIWLFFQDSNFAGQPFDVRSIVALNNRTTLFFDRAIYSFLVGFEQIQSEIKTELNDMYNTFVDRIYHDIRVRLRSDS